MSASRMRTRRAKRVPPGPASGPSMVRAERKMVRVVRERVSRVARVPRGGGTTPHILQVVVVAVALVVVVVSWWS